MSMVERWGRKPTLALGKDKIRKKPEALGE